MVGKETILVAGDAEGREIRALVSKASVGRMMAGIMEETEGDGAMIGSFNGKRWAMPAETIVPLVAD